MSEKIEHLVDSFDGAKNGEFHEEFFEGVEGNPQFQRRNTLGLKLPENGWKALDDVEEIRLGGLKIRAQTGNETADRFEPQTW